LAGPRAPPPAYGRLASAENVRGSEVVPPATLADLDHIDPEFAVFGCHFRKFPTLLDPSFVLAELIPVDVRHVGELGLPADRAGILGRLAVELGRPQKVGMSIADVGDGRAPGAHGRERGPAGQPVIDDGSPRRHVGQSTSEPAVSRARIASSLPPKRYLPSRTTPYQP